MNNRGLILTHNLTLASGLKLYVLQYRPARGTEEAATKRFAHDAAEALAGDATRDCTYLSGPAATRKLAKSVGLEYRERAPGAGRPEKEARDKSVYVPVWMTPTGRDRLDFLRGKRPRGKFIEQHLPIMK